MIISEADVVYHTPDMKSKSPNKKHAYKHRYDPNHHIRFPCTPFFSIDVPFSNHVSRIESTQIKYTLENGVMETNLCCNTTLAALINDFDFPSNCQNSGSDEAEPSSDINQATKDNQTPVSTMTGSKNLTADWDGSQRSKRNHHPASRKVATIVLSLAQLADADWAEAQVATAYKAEHDSKDNDHGSGLAGWEPQSKNACHAEADGEDKSVHPSNHVGSEASKKAAKEGAAVQDGENLECEG